MAYNYQTPGVGENSYHPDLGPQYPLLGERVEKWRQLARHRALTDEETRAYGRAVGEAFKSINHTAKPYPPISMKSTAITTAKIRAAQIAALHASVEKDRREMNYLFAWPERQRAKNGLMYASDSQLAAAYYKVWDIACKRAYAESMDEKRAYAEAMDEKRGKGS